MAIPQATPFDNILAQCRDLFCERLASALAGMLDKAQGALLERENETRDPDAQALYRETRDKVLEQRGKIETQFRARYLREFQLRSNRAKSIGDDFADADLPDVELALVDEADLDETLKFNAMTARLRQYCEEELAALDQRVGVLFGDAGLQPNDNPFTPQAISDAYKQTCAQVDADVEVRLVLLTLFDEFVLDEIRGIYRAVNALLVQNSILPKLRGAGVSRKARAKPPVPEVKGPEQDFFTVLQNLVAQRPAEIAQTLPMAGGVPVPAMLALPGTPAAAGPPGAMAGMGGAGQIVQGEELLRSLTRVQRSQGAAPAGNAGSPEAGVAELATTNVLRELKATNLGGGMSQMDAMTLDIVALLFDQLFDDARIPIGVKGLIGRLQIPFLKVAIADKAFFSKRAHPARQMLDTLGEVAARLPADVNASNPTFARLDEILQGLLEAFEDNLEIFNTVRESLDALVTEEDRRIEEQAQADEKQIEQEESLSLAKTVAQTEIKMRLRDAKLPGAVVEFLLRQWIKVLLLVQVKEGEDSDAWKRALETMDLLIWSVGPKDTREERRELVGKLPDLLRRLADAQIAAGIEDAVRNRFVSELRKLHSEIIAGKAGALLVEPEPAEPEPAELEPAEPEPAEPELALEPERIDVASAQVETPEPAVESPSMEMAPEISAAPEQRPPVLELPPIEFGLSPADKPADTPVERAPAPELIAIVPVPAIEFVPVSSATPVELAADSMPDLDLTAILLKPAIEPQPGIPSKPVEPAPAFELPVIDFAPVSQAAPAVPAAKMPVEPPMAFELPQIVKTPAAPAKPQTSAPGPASPTLAVSPSNSKQPSPVKPAGAPAPVAAKPVVPKPAQLESLDMTAPVTVPNPFGKGQVEVNDLDFTVQSGGGGTAGAKAASGLPPELKLGTWVEILRKHEKQKHQTAKLTFISPLKTRYLFADRHGKTALECSQTELVRQFQLGEVSISKEPTELPLFDRLAEGVAGKLGQPR